MAHWGMVIDLRNCIGCKSCSVACMEANGTPDKRLRQVHDCGVSPPPWRERLCLPTSCMHCQNPSCLSVCPTGATFQREDGIVDIDKDKCVGCGYCIVACPYRARTIYHQSMEELHNGGVGEAQPPLGGVCTKCNFCLPRIEQGLEDGCKPGVDAQASPACVMTCSGKALHFGDLDDPESDVSKLLKENQTVQLRKDLNTDPSVFYILPISWSEVPQEDKKE